MARTARSHMHQWKSWHAALLICTLLSRGQARFLAEQNGASVTSFKSHPGGIDLGSQTESRAILIPESTSMSPLYWFHQQLAAFASIERAVLQRISYSMLESDMDNANTKEELLRHVGCARMRAALLNKATHQGAELEPGSRVSAVSTSDNITSSSGYVSKVMDDTGEGDFENYIAGRVTSRSAYNGGAASGDAYAAGSGGRGADRALAVQRFLRGQNSEGYYSGYDDSDDDEKLEKAMEELWEGEDWDDLYSAEAEYNYSDEDLDEDFQYNNYYYQEDDDESDDDEGDDDEGEQQEIKDFDQEHLSFRQRGIRPLKTMSLRQQYGIEGRALKLREDADVMAFGIARGQSEGSSDASSALATDLSLSATAVSVTPSLEEEDALAAVDIGSTGQEEVDESAVTSFVYDAYNPYDQIDTIGRIGGPGGDDLYFGYEYDMYDDDFQAITLADIMLGKLDIDGDEDEWAEYLEQAYEYLTFYTDDGLYQYDYIMDEYGTNAMDAQNALASLASIAEMVIWTHMGNFVLEVRPGFTVTELSDDGVVIESGPIFLITEEPYSGGSGSYVSALYGLEAGQSSEEPLLLLQQQPDVEVVNDVNMRFVLPDGSLNWGLVTMIILTAGTLAMLVGFIASWLSLRRSMALSSPAWVYVPPRRSGKGSCCGGRFGGKGGKGDCCEYGTPLQLRPDDVKGAVNWVATLAPTVEDASQYLSPKAENESVSRALRK